MDESPQDGSGAETVAGAGAVRTVELIGAAIGEGAPDRRTRGGPGSLRQWGLGRRLTARGRTVRWGPTLASKPDLMTEGPMAVVAEFSRRLSAVVGASLDAGRMPVVIGGDHSCAVGTWSGVAAALYRRSPSQRLGLVWIDAHLDAHTPETSPSQMPHGMPIAALLGHGSPDLTTVLDDRPKLLPQHLVLIGPRSWESGEAALLAGLGVRVITGDEVVRRGVAACLDEAIAQVTDGTAGWGISFDLDAIDPLDAPGTGALVAHGMRVAELATALRGLGCDPRFLACELVEYNPELDARRMTAEAAEAVLGALLDRRGHGIGGPCPEPDRRAGPEAPGPTERS